MSPLGGFGGKMQRAGSLEDFQSEVRSLDASLFSGLRTALAEDEDEDGAAMVGN
mgnify:CR=1 FL=1